MIKLTPKHKAILRKAEQDYLEKLGDKMSEEIDISYKEFIEIYPNGKEPEWILFLSKKYGTPN
jgi:hypothetical protein